MWRTERNLLFLCVAVLYLSYSVHAKSLRQRNRNQRRHNPDNSQQYYWMCPDVVCPALPRGCQHIEYIVFEYDYEVRDGRVVSVRCESCEYCLDLPSFVTGGSGAAAPSSQSAIAPEDESSSRHRRRRSLYDLIGNRRSNVDSNCPPMTCPQLPPACADVRLTDVLIDNRNCGRCPACYDGTVVKNL